MAQHQHVRSKTRSPCSACQGHKVGPTRSRSSRLWKVSVLGEVNVGKWQEATIPVKLALRYLRFRSLSIRKSLAFLSRAKFAVKLCTRMKFIRIITLGNLEHGKGQPQPLDEPGRPDFSRSASHDECYILSLGTEQGNSDEGKLNCW